MKKTGTGLVTLSAFCWGVSAGIGGMLMADGWDPFVVSFHRGAVGLVFVLIWLLLRPRDSGLGDRRVWGWSILAGLGVAGNFGFYFLSISEGSVSVAATLMYSAPVFVYVLSIALGIEAPTWSKGSAIVAAMLGIVLLTRVYNVGEGEITPLGMGAGLLAGLSYALFIFGFSYAATHGSPQAILAIAFSVLVALLLWPADFQQLVSVPTSPDGSMFIALGVLGAGFSFIIYVIGLHYSAPAVASIVAMVEPLTATLFAYLVLHERLAGPQLLGMGLIVAALTSLGVHPTRKRRKPHKSNL